MRDYFPFFKQNPDIVYLDTAATSQTLYTVVEDLNDFMLNRKSNAHRSGHAMGTWIDQRYHESKELLGKWLDIDNPEKKFVFTSGATQSLSDAARMLETKFAAATVFMGIDFHHSLYLPFKQIVDRNPHWKIKFINVNDSGYLDLHQLDRELKTTTGIAVIAATAVSNVLGLTNELKDIKNLADAYSCFTVIDASQVIGKQPVDLNGFDFVAWSWHKVYGPMGLGCLLVDSKWTLTEPTRAGGGSVIDVKIDKTTWQTTAAKFESGTQNLAAIATLPRLIRWLMDHEKDIAEHDTKLAQIAFETRPTTLIPASMPDTGLICYEPVIGAVEDYGMMLDANNIMVRVGRLCAQPLIENYFNQGALIRLSWGPYTLPAEIDMTNHYLGDIYDRISRHVSRTA